MLGKGGGSKSHSSVVGCLAGFARRLKSLALRGLSVAHANFLQPLMCASEQVPKIKPCNSCERLRRTTGTASLCREQCGSSLPPSLNSIPHKSTVLISKGGADFSLGGPEAGVMEVGFSRGLCSSRALLRSVCNIMR